MAATVADHFDWRG